MGNQLILHGTRVKEYLSLLLDQVRDMKQSGEYSPDRVAQLVDTTKAVIQAGDFVSDGIQLALEQAEQALDEAPWVDKERYERIERELWAVIAGMTIPELFQVFRDRIADVEARELLWEVIEDQIAEKNADYSCEWDELQQEAIKKASEVEREVYRSLKKAQDDYSFLHSINVFKDTILYLILEDKTEMIWDLDAFYYEQRVPYTVFTCGVM